MKILVIVYWFIAVRGVAIQITKFNFVVLNAKIMNYRNINSKLSYFQSSLFVSSYNCALLSIKTIIFLFVKGQLVNFFFKFLLSLIRNLEL